MKIFVTDIDGTLVDKNQQISDADLRAITKLQENGVRVILASGRPFFALKKYIKLLNITEPAICFNGAKIVNTKTAQTIYQKKLNCESAQKIWELGLNLKMTIEIWSGDKLYTNALNASTKKYIQFLDVKPHIINSLNDIPNCKIDNQSNQNKNISSTISKILWITPDEKATFYLDNLNLENFGDVNINTSKPHYLEFFHREASKGNALQFIASKYGIPKEQIFAIGDENNDISMLKFAGCGVAMGNSSPEVKRIADFVTKTNENSGIAHAINTYNMHTVKCKGASCIQFGKKIKFDKS